MNRRSLVWLILLGAGCAHHVAPSVANRREPIGCYVAAPALTYSATGAPERGDTSWALVRFDADGRATRPLRRLADDLRSSWRVEGDTLHATFTDGLAGWSLRLTADAAGWSGTALYLTDAIAVGVEPLRQQIVLSAHACSGPA